jgi:hypothetical protein
MRPTLQLSAALLLVALVPGLGRSAPVYTVGYAGGLGSTVSSPVAFHRDSTFDLPPSNGTGTFTGHGFAYPGHVGAFGRVDCVWENPSSGAFSKTTESNAQADDFLISGPEGATSVSGALHLRIQADLSKGGGFGGIGGHGASLNLAATANGISAFGSFNFTNSSTYGDGFLAGQTDPHVDVPFTVSGTFPVGHPFGVALQLSSGGATYGNMYTSPGFVLTDAGGAPDDFSGRGLKLEEVGGQVMGLPAGYTLNSGSWGVVDNHFGSAVGVAAPVARGVLSLEVAGPNPSGGDVRFAVALTRAGRVRIALYDAAGRRVRTFAEGWLPAGPRGFVWDGRADHGGMAAAGLYFLQAELDGRSETRRIVRVR